MIIYPPNIPLGNQRIDPVVDVASPAVAFHKSIAGKVKTCLLYIEPLAERKGAQINLIGTY